LDDYKLTLVRQLKAKCRELREELSETHAIYEVSIPLFCSALAGYCSLHNRPNPLDELSSKPQPSPSDSREAYIAETLTEEEKAQLPSQFKKIFSTIVMQTHPDKNQGGEDGRELYEQAIEAKKDNRVNELVSIAQELKINLSHLSYAAIREIEAQITKTRTEIDSIRQSYPWHWYYAATDKREKIIELFCESR